MTFSLEDWHIRYTQQASWTARLRSHLLGKIEVSPIDRILEVGCGTGVITHDLEQQTKATVIGLDYDFDRLMFAHQINPLSTFACGDGCKLPFADSTFSIVCCHYFLLWIREQTTAISEMVRITRANGNIILFAEPDYEGRIDFPEPFIKYGHSQTEALVKQGIDPATGRKLGILLKNSGVMDIEMGILQWQNEDEDLESAQSEWKITAEDLASTLSANDIKKYLELEQKAWQNQSRIRYVPTFHAMGKVKK